MECDDIKGFVKERWNRRVMPDEFVQDMRDKLNLDDIRRVQFWLLELCGQSHAADPWLLKFLVASMQSIPIATTEQELNECQRVGLVRMVIESGDVLFNAVAIGTTESALCALITLRIVLLCGSPEMIKEAVGKLSRSPCFNILISSGRVFAKEMFQEVRDLFDANYPPIEHEGECTIGQLQLLSALFSKEVSHWLIYHSREELLVLVAATVDLWHLKSCVFAFFGGYSMHLYHHMLQDFISNRSLSGAYIIANLFIRILMNEYRVTDNGEVLLEPFDRDLVVRFVDRVFKEIEADENKDGERTSRFDVLCSPKIERRVCDRFIVDLGREKMLNFLTTLPPDYRSPDYDYSHFIEDVWKYPAFSAMIVEKLIAKLLEKDHVSTISICNQILDKIYDFMILLFTTVQFVSFLSEIAKLVPASSDDSMFEKLLLTLVSLVKYAWRSGAQYCRNLCTQLFDQCDPTLRKLLRIICNEEPASSFSASTDFQSELLYPLERLLNLFNFLIEDQLRSLDKIQPHLSTYPYLWVAVVYWGASTNHPNCRALTSLQFPLYTVLHQSFLHLLTCVDDRNVLRWLELDSNPDFDILVLKSNRSLVDLQYWIVYDIIKVTKAMPIKTTRAWNIAVKWRVLIKRFSLETFVQNVVDILVWSTQVERIHMQSQSMFQAAAMLFIQVAENDEDLMEILRIATAKLEEGWDKISDGYGLAEFCVCLIVSMKTKWREAFLSLMEMRNKILTCDNRSGRTKWMFALCLIQIAMYIPDLQSLMLPDMFEVLIFKHNWQTAIDFFIARSKCDNG